MKIVMHLPILMLLAATALGSETIDEEAAFADGGRLIVSNVSGSVEIAGWDRQRIAVTGQLGDDAELTFEVDGQTARVEVEYERAGRDDRYMEASDLVIRVPRSTRVSATTVSAELDVTGIDALLRLQTVSGDLRAEVHGAEAEAKTVSGDLDVTGHASAARLTVAAVSGDIDISNVAGEIAISSVSGDAEVTAGDVARLRAKSVSGDIDFSGNLQTGGRIDVESLSGEVHLRLASLYDAEYRLRSFSGDITPVLGRQAEDQSRFGPGRKLELTEGAGSSRIDVETMSGDIAIEATGAGRREPDVQQTSGDTMDFDPGVDIELAMETLERELAGLDIDAARD